MQLKKQRRHNESAIDLSNANPARGHKEVRRSTGRIVVTTRYSNQQGSKSRLNSCQVQPTESMGNLSASRRCLWVRTTVSLSINTSYRKDCLICCPSNKEVKRDSRSFSNSWRVTRRQVMRHCRTNGTCQCQNGS